MQDKEFNLYYLGDFIYKIKFIIIIFLILGYAIGYFIKDDPIIEKSGRFEFDTISNDIREINDLANIVLTNKLFQKLNSVRNSEGNFVNSYEIFKADINYAFLLDTLSREMQSKELRNNTVNSITSKIDKQEALETLFSTNYKYQNKETAKQNYVTFVVANVDTNLNEKEFKELITFYFNNLREAINTQILNRLTFIYDKQQQYNNSIKEYLQLSIDANFRTDDINDLKATIYELNKIIESALINKDEFLNNLSYNLNSETIRVVSSNSLKISYFVKTTDDMTTILISILISFILSILFGYFYYLRIKKIS